jgi:hypothetical protein
MFWSFPGRCRRRGATARAVSSPEAEASCPYGRQDGTEHERCVVMQLTFSERFRAAFTENLLAVGRQLRGVHVSYRAPAESQMVRESVEIPQYIVPDRASLQARAGSQEGGR